MKKGFKKFVAFVLAFTLLAIALTQSVLAEVENNAKYVSEIKMATCKSLEDAKKELEGYIVVETNLNEQMPEAEQVYMGYKTTSNKKEAITDLKMMDMNGGYSYNDYGKVLDEQLNTIKAEIDSFLGSVTEFQKNYAEQKPAALYAYSLMNQFKDDDQNGKLLGDIFLDASVNADKLATIFLQGNSIAITSLEQALAIACTDDWLDRLKTKRKEIYTTDASTLDDWCELIRLQWNTFNSGLTHYEDLLDSDDGYDMSEYTEETYQEWLKETNPSETVQTYVFNYGTAYNILDDYGLVDYFETELSEVTYEYLYPMADAMTIGQLQTLKYIGIASCISFSQIDYKEIGPILKANQDTMAQNALSSIQKQFGEAVTVTLSGGDNPISIYEGVDRTLFNKDDGVALTNDALRKMNSSDDKSAVAQIFNNAKISLPISFVVSVALVIVAAINFSRKAAAAAKAEVFAAAANFFEGRPVSDVTMMAQQSYDAVQASFSTAQIFMGVAIGILLISVGLSLFMAYYKYKNPTYKTVPRAIVDETEEKVYDSFGNVTGTKKHYVGYYPVKDAVANSKNGEYADMNAWKAQQWNVMYYTKNEKAGQPILADTFVVQVGNNKRPAGYAAFSKFGMTVAADVNTHAFEEIPGIYIFYKTEPKTSSGAASVFTGGYYAVAAIAGIVIGALGMLGGYIVHSKKKKKKVATPENA